MSTVQSSHGGNLSGPRDRRQGRQRAAAVIAVVALVGFAAGACSSERAEGPAGEGQQTVVSGSDPMAVGEPYSILHGEVTFSAAPPWGVGFAGPWGLWLEDNFEERVHVLADPLPIEARCRPGVAPADSEALAGSIMSDPDLEATKPVAVAVGGIEALRMDVVAATGGSVCPKWEGPGVVRETGVDDPDASVVLDRTQRMRLYLLELPGWSSARILAIAIVAPKPRFEHVIEVATPIVDSFEFEQRPITYQAAIRQMTNALNAMDAEAFMDAFVQDGWFNDGDGVDFLENGTTALLIESDAASIEAWMALNDAWGLEAEVIDCRDEPADPPAWNVFPPSDASERRNRTAECRVRTRWHTLSLEVTEDWDFEFDGTTLLSWSRGLRDVDPSDRTLPLGAHGLLDWERWVKANRPEDAALYLSPRWTGPKRADYMEFPYPACAHDGPCRDEWNLNRNAWDNGEPHEPWETTGEKKWSIKGQNYFPSGLMPYNPAFADEIEVSIQDYLADR